MRLDFPVGKFEAYLLIESFAKELDLTPPLALFLASSKFLLPEIEALLLTLWLESPSS